MIWKGLWGVVSVMLLYSCTYPLKNTQNMVSRNDSTFTSKIHKTPLHKLEKLWVVGDFDGDHKTDTLFEHNFSDLHHIEIDSAADPFQTEWDTVVNWFYKQEADVYLTLHHNAFDTLHLGTAQGLYCLINLGDLNADGTDEIALVVDYCDFSSLNSCKIYTCCHRKWTQIHRFSIFEGAFDHAPDSAPTYAEIKGYLEKQNNHWTYLDYLQTDDDSAAATRKMKPLIIHKCP